MTGRNRHGDFRDAPTMRRSMRCVLAVLFLPLVTAWSAAKMLLPALPDLLALAASVRPSKNKAAPRLRRIEMPLCPLSQCPHPGRRATTDLHELDTPTRPHPYHEHESRPCGSGSVQFCVAPSFTITTFAVALPSYVIVSERVVVVGD